MVSAVVLVVGAIVVWIVADHAVTWFKERKTGGPSAWRGHGPGSTFHSSGFEDTVPPHEAVDTSLRRRGVQRPS